MSEELLAVILGAIAGTFTGLIPGIHANTIALLAFMLPVEKNIPFACFIISMSITHSFADAIPSILLGAPSEETFLSILPGHKMLLEGKGIDAIKLTIFGGIVSGLTALALAPAFYSIAQKAGEFLPALIPAALVFATMILLKSEKNLWGAIVITVLAGALGIVALEKGNSIFALVTGFFAIPSLVTTILTKTIIPKQKETKNEKAGIGTCLVTGITAGFTSMTPGIGPSQAIHVQKNFSKMGEREYLCAIGGMNTANLVMSLTMLFAIGKTRTGMALTINSFMQVTQENAAILFSAALISIGIAALATEYSSKKAIGIIQKIDYPQISKIILTMLIALIFFTGGITGLLCAIAAAGTAFLSLNYGVKRSHSMAFLVMPTLLLYLGIIL